jgi:ribonuclease HI
MIVWLKVPFAEKDQAKALGARWNPAQKKWYVKDVADLSPFEAWMTEQPATVPDAPPPSTDAPASGVAIYCDGACRGNPGGPGGWGAWIQTPDKAVEIYGGAPDTTNNRMELTAAIEALRWVVEPTDIVVYTDSQYVVKGMTEWRHGWVKKNWKDVKNPELWKTLIDAAQRHKVSFRWVRGHNGHAGNERADALANEGLEHARRTGAITGVIRELPLPAAREVLAAAG